MLNFKIKSLFKASPVAMIILSVLVAGVASAAVLHFYGSTTGSAKNVKQSVMFSDGSQYGTTTQTYEVGNSDPVAGNVYYDLVVLKNNASDKPATVQLKTSYASDDHAGYWNNEEGISTSYMHWKTPVKALTGVRPTAVYNSYDGTGYQNYKEYEVWYKVHEKDAHLHYAYYHPDSSWHYTWGGADTNVDGGYDAPFVMKEDGKYYMVNYGSNDHKDFYIYTSGDGTSWTKGPQIYTEKHANFAKVDNPKIIKDETGYKMYFQVKVTGSNPKYFIYLATSDAKNLKEIAAGDKTFGYKGLVLAPGAEGEWDSFRVMQPMVFKSGNTGYLMLYTGYDKYYKTSSGDISEIGYATSKDGITNWTKIKVSKEGYDTNLGTIAHKVSVVKTNDNLVLFYQNGSKIDWTWLTSISNPMTLQPQEYKPFFIKNDFAINLVPETYKIKTSVNPITVD